MNRTKFSVEEINEIFWMKSAGYPISQICKKFSVDYGYVYRVIKFFTGERKPKVYSSKAINDKIRLCKFVSERMEDCGSIFRIIYILNRNGVFSPEDVPNLDLEHLKYTYNIGAKTMDDLREIKGLPRLEDDGKRKLIFKVSGKTGETKKKYGHRQILAIKEFLEDFNATCENHEKITIREKH